MAPSFMIDNDSDFNPTPAATKTSSFNARTLLLTEADGTRNESTQLLGREVFARIVQALKAGGKLQAQHGTFGQDTASVESREAIMAGLVPEGDGMTKPDYSASEAVPLRLRRKEKSADMAVEKPTGVGFVDFSDDFGEPMITGEDDE